MQQAAFETAVPENNEAPPAWSGIFPLITSAAIIVLIGIFNGPIVALIRTFLEDLPLVAMHF